MIRRQLELRWHVLIAVAAALGEMSLILYGIVSTYPSISGVTRMLTLSVIGTLGVLIFLYIPELGIGLYLFNGIFKTSDIVGDAESIVPTLFILALTLAVLMVKRSTVAQRPFKIDLFLGLLVGFNALLIISSVATGTTGALEKALRLTFFTGMSLLMAFLITRSPKQLLQAFRYTALLAAVTATLSVLTFVGENIEGVRSVTLFAANDVIFGRTVALGILLSFGLLLYDPTLPPSWRWLLSLSFPVTLVSLILSTSRGATVGLVGSAVFALLIQRKRPPLWVFGLIALSAVAYIYVTATWGNRVIDLTNFSIFTSQTGFDLSTRQRLVLYEQAYQQYLAHPLLGIGTQSNAYYPHNIFLEVASELGTLGIGLFILMTWQLIRKLRQLLRQPSDPVVYAVAQLTVIGLVYSLLIAQFSGNLQHQRSLWLFVAFAWALHPQNGSQLQESKLESMIRHEV